MTNLLTPDDIAAHLGLCRRTVMRAIDAGDLRASELARGKWFVTEDDFDAWLELRANTPRERTVAPRPAARIEPSHVGPARPRRSRGGHQPGTLTVTPSMGRST